MLGLCLPAQLERNLTIAWPGRKERRTQISPPHTHTHTPWERGDPSSITREPWAGSLPGHAPLGAGQRVMEEEGCMVSAPHGERWSQL